MMPVTLTGGLIAVVSVMAVLAAAVVIAAAGALARRSVSTALSYSQLAYRM